VLALSLTWPALAWGAGSTLTDPAADGTIGLCDSSGHQLTKGSINDAPFVWRAVSSVPAAARYAGDGRTATLFAYQPRPSTPAAQWSGDVLGASGRYTNPAHPMAALTVGDEPLSDFLSDFPVQQDGLIQLRIYLGAPGQPAYSLTYPATTLKISGTSWQVVNPAKADCTSGTSVSLETLVGVGGSPAPSTAPVTSAAAPATVTTGSGTSASPFVIAGAVIVAISAVVWFIRRDRRRRPQPAPQPIHELVGHRAGSSARPGGDRPTKGPTP
jgi:hypothetical protein